jgi:hypothetical protein
VQTLKFLKNEHPSRSFKLKFQVGTQVQTTTSSKPSEKKLKFKDLLTFDMSEDLSISLSLIQENYVFLASVMATCSFKINPNSSASTKSYFLCSGNEILANVIVSHLVDEKTEPFWKIQMIHKIELEKEGVKFRKQRYLKKLNELKNEKTEFRENMSHYLNELKENIDFKRSKNGSVNKSEVISCKASIDKSRISSLGNKNARSHVARFIY